MGSLQPTLTMGSLFRESAAQRWVRETEEVYALAKETVKGLGIKVAREVDPVEKVTPERVTVTVSERKGEKEKKKVKGEKEKEGSREGGVRGTANKVQVAKRKRRGGTVTESCKDTNDISDIPTVSTDFVDMTTVSADITEITTVSSVIRKILSETVLRPRKTSTSTMQRLVTVTLVILLFSNIYH